MILDFHLSPYRDATSAFSLIHSCQVQYGTLKSMCVSDRYPAYREAFKRLLPEKYISEVEDFADDISNNII